MARTKTSKAWLREHVNDTYVKRAKSEGYRSRAAYKILEIDARDRLFKPGMRIVDLGAAPGGWAQVAAQKLQGNGTIVALDILEMPALPGVHFIQGDFTDAATLEQLTLVLNKQPVDLVICDMAPNISGVGLRDQARAFELSDLALDFSAHHLKKEGRLLVKVFQGVGFEEFLTQFRQAFVSVVTRKPKASRDRSNECYLLGSMLKLG